MRVATTTAIVVRATIQVRPRTHFRGIRNPDHTHPP